jgi:hypothetical protein
MLNRLLAAVVFIMIGLAAFELFQVNAEPDVTPVDPVETSPLEMYVKYDLPPLGQILEEWKQRPVFTPAGPIEIGPTERPTRDLRWIGNSGGDVIVYDASHHMHVLREGQEFTVRSARDANDGKVMKLLKIKAGKLVFQSGEETITVEREKKE